MQTIDIIIGLWWIYAIAAAVLIWYAISTARERSERAGHEWEAMMNNRESESDPIPEMPKFRNWDIYVYYWVGAALGILAFLCATLKLLEFIAVSFLGAQ